MFYRSIFLILAGCLLAGNAWAQKPSHSGFYDSVQVSPETGDEGGVRIQVNDGPSPTVDFALCEGECFDLKRFPAKIVGDRLSFTFVEPGFNREGKQVTEIRARVYGRFVSRGLLLKMDFLANPSDDNGPYTLIPRRKRRP